MKCAACHAHIAKDTTKCPHCGHKITGERSAKKTMMGLPAMFPAGNGGDESPDKKNERHTDRSTLFGTPAVVDNSDSADKSPVSPPETLKSDEADSSTQIAPPSVVEAAISGSFEAAPGPPMHSDNGGGAHETEFGLPAVKGDEEGARANRTDRMNPSHRDADSSDSFSKAWGLDEESEEPSRGSTQVAGASLMDAIRESSFGGESPGKKPTPTPAKSDRESKKTLMGIHFEDMPEDSTRPVDEQRLAQIRAGVPKAGIVSQDAASDESPKTEVLRRETNVDAEDDDAPNRRQKLLRRLRSKRGSEASTDKATGASPGATDDPAAGSGEDLLDVAVDALELEEVEVEAVEEAQPDVETGTDERVEVDPIDGESASANSWTGGPRFSIPTPASTPSAPRVDADGADVQTLSEEPSVEDSDSSQESFVTQDPVADPQSAQIPRAGGAKTAFPTETSPRQPQIARSEQRQGGVFDSLEGVSLDSIQPEATQPEIQPEVQLDDAPSPIVDAAPDSSAPASATPAQQPQNDSKAGPIRVIKGVCAALIALGLLAAGYGALMLFGGAQLSPGVSASVATICLVAGCVICVCAGFFLLALKWIS